MLNLSCVVRIRKLCCINRDTLWFPNEQLTTLVNWFAGAISIVLATSCFQTRDQTTYGLCHDSALFDSQWHAAYVPSASRCWRHRFYGAVLLCVTGRGLAVGVFRPTNNLAQPNSERGLSSVGYQESHPVHALRASSRLLSSVKA